MTYPDSMSAPAVKYEVTGVDVYGKRFKKVYLDPRWAFGINLWRGSVWERDVATGKRRLLKRVDN